MTLDEFMKLHDERKRRNIDPFELQVFHEEQSASLKEYISLLQSDNAKKDLETLSQAPSNTYKGFSQQRGKKQ